MPNLAGIKINPDWRAAEAALSRQSWRGWHLLAGGLGAYLALMFLVRFTLPVAGGTAAAIEYALSYFLYIPLTLLYIFGDGQKAGRKVLLWLALTLIPGTIATMVHGGFLNPDSTVAGFIGKAVYPFGLGLWVTVLLGRSWRHKYPNELAGIGILPLGARRQIIHFGLGAAAALLLLLHLQLTLNLADFASPVPRGFDVILSSGFALGYDTLGEELFYRGFFFQYLRRWNWSFWPAALLVSFFDALHFLILAGPGGDLTTLVGLVYYVFIYSVINCALINWTKNIITPWAANTFFTIGVKIFGL